MRLRNLGVLGLSCGLVVLWMGCSGDRTGSQICAKGPDYVPKHGLARHGEACARDADCQSRFCDRAVCIDPRPGMGNPCGSPAPDARPLDKLPERVCGAFVCLAGRCRSCRSNAECQSYLGVGECTVHNDPGSPKYAVCEPNTTRLPNNAECTEDAECQSLLCDRRTCAVINSIGRHNYGEVCVSRPPQPPPKDLRVAPPGGKCEGYLCVDERCRSCQSDAECQKGSSDLVCLEFSDWAGKVCVTQSEADLHPLPYPARPPAFNPDDY